MIRKWIEIVFCTGPRVAVPWLLVAPIMALPLIGLPAAGVAAVHRMAPSSAAGEAQSFPVRIDEIAPPRPLAPLPGVAADTRESVAGGSPLSEAFVPDIPYSYFWSPQDGLRLRSIHYARRHEISRHSPGLLGAFEAAPANRPGVRWPAVPGDGDWTFGASSWRTRWEEGPELQLGRSEIAVPEWNEAIPLGGISLSQSFLASSDSVSRWNYSLAFGAVDQSVAGSTELEFGPAAGSLALTYDYSPYLSLESRTEVTADLVMSGLTGQYDLGSFGRWRSGIARSSQGMSEGWRYRAAADFDLADDWRLAWVGERHTDGFMDIRRHADGAAPVAGRRQRWSASWDAGRWGTWSGSFESMRDRRGEQRRRFGMSQQFWYSPNLQVGLHAEREVVGDDYDIGLRLSFPLY